jgi:hypothetical protein
MALLGGVLERQKPAFHEKPEGRQTDIASEDLETRAGYTQSSQKDGKPHRDGEPFLL